MIHVTGTEGGMEVKKKLCKAMALLAALILLISAAAEEAETPGVWYGYTNWDVPVSLDFQPKSACYRTYGGFTRKVKGKWTQDGKLLTVKIGSDTWYFQWDGESLVMDGMGSMLTFDDIPFSREKYEEYFPAKQVRRAKPEDFDGLWEARYSFEKEYYQDIVHRGKPNWYYYADDSTAIWYIRVDSAAKTISMLNRDKVSMGDHTIQFNSNSFRDTHWRDTYTLMEDGALYQKDGYGFYFFRVQE